MGNNHSDLGENMYRIISTKKLKTNFFMEGLNFLVQKAVTNSCLDFQNPDFNLTGLFSRNNAGCYHSDVKPNYPIEIDLLFKNELEFSEIRFHVQSPSPNNQTFYDRAPKSVRIETTTHNGVIQNFDFTFDRTSLETKDYSCCVFEFFKARSIKISIDENFGDEILTIGYMEIL